MPASILSCWFSSIYGGIFHALKIEFHKVQFRQFYNVKVEVTINIESMLLYDKNLILPILPNTYRPRNQFQLVL